MSPKSHQPVSHLDYVALHHRLLDPATARDILNTRPVGSIAYVLNARPHAEPVYCVIDRTEEEWLYIRPLPGSMLTLEEAGAHVAVTVRRERSLTDWTQITAYGILHRIDPSARLDASTSAGSAVHRRAIELLRTVAPDMLAPDFDANAETFFRLSIESVVGRECYAIAR